MKITIEVPYPGNNAIRSWGLKNGMGGENYGPVRWDIRKAFEAAHQEALRQASDWFVADCANWSDWDRTVCRERCPACIGYVCGEPKDHQTDHRCSSKTHTWPVVS